MPPLYRLSHGAKTFYARDDKHKDEILKKEFHANAKVEIGRFKGLGEMMAHQLKETTMDPRKRTLLQVRIADDDRKDTAKSVERLMGNKAEARFEFIQERAEFAERGDAGCVTAASGFGKRGSIRHHTILSVVCGLNLCFCFGRAAQAESRFDQENNSTVHITGTIWDRDAGRMQNLADEFAKVTPQFSLDSKGGDVLAAMRIGQLIRKLEGRTTVAARAKCHSACALIFIAGVERTDLGEIGLHRPYLDSDPELLKNHLPI